MAKKKGTLKGFSSDELLQELIKRCQERADEYRGDAECMEAEANDIEDSINTLNEIVLEW